PSRRLTHKSCSTRITTQENVPIDVPAEDLFHLRVGPLLQTHHLEAACKTFRESLLHEQRRGPQEDHFQPQPGPAVLIPLRLYDIAPLGHFLHLVDHQYGSFSLLFLGQQSRTIPLCGHPCGLLCCGIIGAHTMCGEPQTLEHLCHQRTLAHLTWTGHHLNETARPGKAFPEGGIVGALVWHGAKLLNALSKITQCTE